MLQSALLGSEKLKKIALCLVWTLMAAAGISGVKPGTMRRFWSRLSFHVQIFLLLVCLFQLEEIKCNTVGPEGRVSVPCVLEDLDCCQKGGSWNSSVLQLHSSLLFLPLLLPSLPRCTGNCLLLRKMKDVPAFTNPKQVFEPLGT